MKMKRKLGIGILLAAFLVMSVGTALASGGSTYNGASGISVPLGTYDYFGVYTKGSATGDWFKFYTTGAESIYIDLKLIFYRDYHGEMLQYRSSSDVQAHVCQSPKYNDHWGQSYSDSWPRIEMRGDSGATYDFICGRY
jgi:hypothetical protein